MTYFDLTHPAQHECQASPINMQLAFARRSTAGLAEFQVEDVKLGRKISMIRIIMSQKDVVKVEGYITVSSPEDEASLSPANGIGVTASTMPLPLIENSDQAQIDHASTERVIIASPWKRVSIPFPEFRKATSHVEVYGHEPGLSADCQQRNTTDQWACLGWSEGEHRVSGRWTNEAAAFLLDIFPATLAKLEAEANSELATPVPVWFPTLSLNVDFTKQLPKKGVPWLHSRVTVKSVRNGRVNIEVVLGDMSGEIVAIATQSGLVISSQRNKSKI